VAGKRIGVLALQGGFAAHRAALRRAGAEALEVRRPAELDGVAGLVIPGGESTTMLRLMDGADWSRAVRALVDRGGALLGTCAGAILLARVVRPPQPSLGLLDIVVDRNAYGRQVDSFEATLGSERAALGTDRLPAIFIRAPRLRVLGPGVEVLARLGVEPVLVREGRVLAATFHPELTASTAVHRLLVDLSAAAAPSPVARAS
jgi:5'-phosphate synthase pdxT subunit